MMSEMFSDNRSQRHCRRLPLRALSVAALTRTASPASPSPFPVSAVCALCAEIGAGLTGFGTLFLVLGCLLFFDKALLALGNVTPHTPLHTHGARSSSRHTTRRSLAVLSARLPACRLCALCCRRQLLFLLGITLLIGFKKTLIFFKRPAKLRGTVCFLGGIALVLVGWPVVGMAVEVFGILNLFGNFFPIILSLLRNMPVVGPVLSHPIFTKVSQAADRLGQRRQTPV